MPQSYFSDILWNIETFVPFNLVFEPFLLGNGDNPVKAVIAWQVLGQEYGS